ncbi:uncharacterized protein MELLADRAFT_66668 [Melampsora larici-populina 98AG31]|uniref:Secreted protein n=1 Tax=Melampsora larici-populina (strain 98AG31 / pathotype 3-4-7) TaxID=747676 RepID=F4S054_MELLP|nr:uncharacterized protein MELLADRAFT_66668 [Melampsora larici-populina 98AG31]EGG01996.1 hypothetical protein MELLADRAFT_66668 [Melampsora larici-populina 98AG31]
MKLYYVLFTIHSCLAMKAFAMLPKDALKPKSPIPINHDPRIQDTNFPSHSLSSSIDPSMTGHHQMQSTTDPRIFEINIIPVHSTNDPLQPTVNGKPVKLYGVLPHAMHGNQSPSEHGPMEPSFGAHGHIPQGFQNRHFGTFASPGQHPDHDPSGTSSPDFVKQYLDSLVQSGQLQRYQPIPGDTLHSGYPNGVTQPIGGIESRDVQVYLRHTHGHQAQYDPRGQGDHNEDTYDVFDPTEPVRRRYLGRLEKSRGPRDGDPMNINLDVLGLINPKLRSENFAQQSESSEKSYHEDSNETKLEAQGKNLKIPDEDGTTKNARKIRKKKSKAQKLRLGEWMSRQDQIVHDSKGKGDSQKKTNLSTNYSLLPARDAIAAMLETTLKENDQTENLRIHLSQTDFDHIRNTGLIKSWSDWGPFMQKFLENFTGAEGLRRVSAVMTQFDQFMISKMTAENYDRFTPNVLELSENLRLKEHWPIFYDVKFADWDSYVSDLEQLTRYNHDDSNLLESIISPEVCRSRLKTMKVMSDANLENYTKLFEKKELEEFARSGLSVPVIQRIDTIFQLSRPEMIKDTSTYILRHVQKLHDFYEILRGRFVELPTFLHDTTSWFDSPEANLFISLPNIKDRFLSRLRNFLEEIRRYPVAYKIWEEGDQSPVFKLKPSPQDWEYQKIDGAEAVTCALFGLPLKHFAIMKNEMLHRRKPNDHNLIPNTLQWPKEISEEIKPHLESFKRVYDFLGVAVLGLNAEFNSIPNVKSRIIP